MLPLAPVWWTCSSFFLQDERHTYLHPCSCLAYPSDQHARKLYANNSVNKTLQKIFKRVYLPDVQFSSGWPSSCVLLHPVHLCRRASKPSFPVQRTTLQTTLAISDLYGNDFNFHGGCFKLSAVPYDSKTVDELSKRECCNHLIRVDYPLGSAYYNGCATSSILLRTRRQEDMRREVVRPIQAIFYSLSHIHSICASSWSDNMVQRTCSDCVEKVSEIATWMKLHVVREPGRKVAAWDWGRGYVSLKFASLKTQSAPFHFLTHSFLSETLTWSHSEYWYWESLDLLQVSLCPSFGVS